ncbi:MAG: hypothetical protein KA051_00900 [Paludibacteraceae bacterium]|nr:hypothetical protein [Paludibacteraceae bacterium]
MGTIFGFLYGLLKSIFGNDLNEYLKGSYGSGGDDSVTYFGIGLLTFILAAAFSFLYYKFAPVSKSKCGAWVVWGLITAAIAGLVAYFWVKGDLDAGRMIQVTDDGTSNLPINVSNCIFFGVSNVIVSCVFYVLISFVWRLLAKHRVISHNAANVPF